MNSEPYKDLVQQFHTTHWSVVLTAGKGESEQAGAALSRLCQTYWFPIYAFIRKRGHSPEQAQDLTQEFFARFLENNSVSKVVRERGRFRVFLMTSVQNFLYNEYDRTKAQKRGGGQELVSLDQSDAEARYLIEPVAETDPARAFDQRWAATLLETVVGRLRAEFNEEGRGSLFEELQAHLWGDTESSPYSQLAERFGMTVANLKSMAHRLRQRYRELLREEIGHTVTKPGEINDEIRHLMTIVSQ